jgi:hypothetical protein
VLEDKQEDNFANQTSWAQRKWYLVSLHNEGMNQLYQTLLLLCSTIYLGAPVAHRAKCPA